MTPDLRPPPQPDSTTKFFWDAAADHLLVLQRCSACGYREYPPEVVCTECQREDFEYEALSGRGTLFSFAVVERAFHPGFVAHLPYVVAMVELVEQPGLRLLTNVVDADPAMLEVGMELEVVFEEREHATLPQFRPVDPSR